MKKEHSGKTCKQAHPHMSHVMWEKIKKKHEKNEKAEGSYEKQHEAKKTKKSPKRKGSAEGSDLRAAPEPAMVGSVSNDRGFVGLAGIPVPSAVEKVANALMGYPGGLSSQETMGDFKHGGEVPETGPYQLHKGEHVVPNPDDNAGGDPQTAVDKLNELLDTLTGARKDAEKFDRGNSRAGVRLRKAAVEAARELKSLRAEVQNVKGQRKASKSEARQELVDKVASAWIKISDKKGPLFRPFGGKEKVAAPPPGATSTLSSGATPGAKKVMTTGVGTTIPATPAVKPLQGPAKTIADLRGPRLLSPRAPKHKADVASAALGLPLPSNVLAAAPGPRRTMPTTATGTAAPKPSEGPATATTPSSSNIPASSRNVTTASGNVIPFHSAASGGEGGPGGLWNAPGMGEAATSQVLRAKGAEGGSGLIFQGSTDETAAPRFGLTRGTPPPSRTRLGESTAMGGRSKPSQALLDAMRRNYGVSGQGKGSAMR